MDDVRTLLVDEVAKLCKGDFDADLIKAVVNNYKLALQNQLEERDSHADMYVNAFVNGEDWSDVVSDIERLDKITKEDIVEVANRYFGTSNYVAVYKRRGNDDSVLKIAKPPITPIATNRDAASNFLREVQASAVTPVEPRLSTSRKTSPLPRPRKAVLK